MNKYFQTITVSIFSIFILFSMQACSEEDPYKHIKETVEEYPGADGVVQNFEAHSYGDKGPLWHLIGDKAFVFQKEDITYIIGVNLDYFKNGKKTTHVTGAKGIMDSKKGTLRVEGDVKVNTTEGRRLFTEYLIWSTKKNRLTTKSKVKIITQEGDTIRGKGFSADQKLEKMVLGNAVGKSTR